MTPGMGAGGTGSSMPSRTNMGSTRSDGRSAISLTSRRSAGGGRRRRGRDGGDGGQARGAERGEGGGIRQGHGSEITPAVETKLSALPRAMTRGSADNFAVAE